MYKVLIADDCLGKEAEAKRILRGYDIEGYFCGRDGREVVKEIENVKPDVAVINVAMRSIDGLGVLSLMKGKNDAPKFIIMYYEDDGVRADEAMVLGATYCLPLPMENHMILARIDTLRIRLLLESLNGVGKRANDTETEITEMLHMLAVPAHIKGYQYLREAITLVLRDGNLINSVTKELYPAVAKRFGTTASRAERAIRHAIEVAWDRGEVDVMNGFFGYTIRSDRGKPTNSEFIALVADKLRLKYRVG